MDKLVRTQDEWLALRCQSGEPDAFEDLVRTMERPLFYYAANLLGNEELRRQRWYVAALWFWVVGLGATLMLLASLRSERPNAAFLAASFGTFACFMLICGAAELLKYFLNRTRVELLKETKQVQLQVLELHELLRKRGVSSAVQ